MSSTRLESSAASRSGSRRDSSNSWALQHLATCRRSMGSDRAVAGILGVSPAQVSRWRSGQRPDLDNADRLAGLALVVEMLARWLAPEAVEGWLHGQNAHLSNRSPAHLIRLGRIAEVIGAIELEKAGVYS